MNATDGNEHDDLLRELARHNPVSASDLRSRLDDESLATARTRALGLARDGASEPARPLRPLAVALPGSRMRLALAVGALAAVGIVVALVSGSIGGPASTPSAYAAEAVRVAEANQRLLVTAPGWQVISANGFSAGEGEVTFSDGTEPVGTAGQSELSLQWFPASEYQPTLRGWREVATEREIELVGGRATVFEGSVAEHSAYYVAVLEPADGTVVVARGRFASETNFLDVLHSLRSTDVDNWLAEMPASVVQSEAREATVQSMLSGIPIPPGFDTQSLTSGELVSDRYQVGARTTAAIACEWLDRWVDATNAGDAARAARSVEAMSTSFDWPILREMADEGGFSEVVWRYAREIADGDLDQGFGVVMRAPGDDTFFELGPAYATALGCDSLVKRPVGGGPVTPATEFESHPR